jgi:UDP-glucose 4-epimerase
MRILLTGATGKVGQNLLPALLQDSRFAGSEVVALCNHRMLTRTDRVEVIRGSLADPVAIAAAMKGVTHVIHMAAVKETPDQAIDVALKGMFLLLEEARQSASFRQFILIGGDCSIGHFFHGYDGPITESSPRRAYAGCYALTKVLEEVMLEQVQIQYGLNGCILRAPWIMEKDDLRYALSFGPDQFGGPAWHTLMPVEEVTRLASSNAVPLMRDQAGDPLKRNFIHVSDLVSAILAALDNSAARQRLFHIGMDQPVDYGTLAAILALTRNLLPVEIATPFHSNWLDITAARAALGWEPAVDLEAMVEMAWAWDRKEGDPRKVWYPG